jgi:inositol oxygenase
MLKKILLGACFFSGAMSSPVNACDKTAGGKEQAEYRIYDESTADHVKQFYIQNHALQTVESVLQKKREYSSLAKAKMGIWEAVSFLDTLVDESDPDLGLPQSHHAFQVAEALRKDGYPRWMIATGFVHDLGKMLALYGEPQWAVVGDTFPVGCAWSDAVVFPQYFTNNPDSQIAEYQTQYGIYWPACGLENVHMSWGHNEYLYQVMKKYLPAEALHIIRYHSFHALHEDGAYEYLLNEDDKAKMEWLKLFHRYDTYSKKNEQVDAESLLPYYQELMAEFFPEQLDW